MKEPPSTEGTVSYATRVFIIKQKTLCNLSSYNFIIDDFINKSHLKGEASFPECYKATYDAAV